MSAIAKKTVNIGKGIYAYKNDDGSTTFSIKIRIDGILHNIKVGKDTEGINLQYCKNERDNLIVGIRRGETVVEVKRNNGKITLNDVADSYFKAKEGINKSIKNEINRYDTHLRNTLGKKEPKKITHLELENLQQIKLKTLAVSTTKHIIELLRTIINYGIKKELIPLIVNPYSKMEKIKGDDNHRERFLTLLEIKELYEEIKDDEVMTMFVRLALKTGGRRNAILAITVKDIDFPQHTIRLMDFKSSKRYTSYLTKNDIIFIKNHIQKYNLKSSSYIVSYDGKMRNGDSFSSKLQPILNKLFNEGLEKDDSINRVVVHSLRHTFASHLAINGTPIFTIQKLMNHKDIKMTMRYAHLSNETFKPYIEALYKDEDS